MTSEAELRDVHARWHAHIVGRDYAGLGALYADDAIFESPAVLALDGGVTGVLVGRPAIQAYFEVFFAKLGAKAPAWHRSEVFLSRDGQVAWEYPRETPDGDQVDLVEWMDVRGGLIARHRVYWGWVGLKTLTSASGNG